MTKKRLYKILIPTATFFSGIFIQFLIERWVFLGIVTTTTLILVLLSLGIIFASSLHILESIDNKFDDLDTKLNGKFDIVNEKLLDIFKHSGLYVECIEDGKENASRIRMTELVKAAKHSITTVSFWHHYRETYVDTTTNIYASYYKALEEKITEHQNDKTLFFRKIIQIPQGNKDTLLEFAKETPHFRYLQHAIMTQTHFPRSCQVRKCANILNIQFIIVDRRYIIMPIHSLDKKYRSKRYGALIYDDTQKNFVNYLESLYDTLNSISEPILMNSLILSNGQSSSNQTGIVDPGIKI